jgi:DNA-binding Lrp family transcriptional regulator
VEALKRLGHDTVLVEVWDCQVVDALLAMMAYQQNRNWTALEEALLLQELQTRCDLSQAAIAQRTGRSKSWVSARLLLIESLPEVIREAVRSGVVSSWVAVRIFEPFARANAQHATSFLNYVSQHHHSTRELKDFFAHYKDSSTQVRENLIKEPALYFQSKRTLAKHTNAKQFAPETQRLWFEPLTALKAPLAQMLSGFDKTFYVNQPAGEQQTLIDAFEPIRQQFHLLETKLEEMHHAQSRNTPNDSMPA